MSTIAAQRSTVAALAFLAILPSSFAQADPADIAKIINEGKNHNKVMDHLNYLATKIGPRLTSSSNLEKAYKWTLSEFTKYGCKNVHLEQWGEFPVGFDRGTHSFGHMVSPEKIDFEFTTQSWTEGTNGPQKGPAVMAPKTMDDFNKVKDQLKGAWVVFDAPPPGRGGGRPGQPPPELTPEQKAAIELQDAIMKAGILGIVTPSRNDLCVTSGQWRDKTYDNHPMDHRVMVRKSDMDKIVADLSGGKPVTLEFNLDQKFRQGGPVKTYNVVAEIPGTEKPDEVVIVSGHLDSWDGPGSQGALDNGTGSCTALEAARILCAAKVKPKRTIRFILWTGEEEGLFGSRAYVKQHQDEWSKISAVLVDDGGTGYQAGYVGGEFQRAMMEAAFTPVVAAFPDMPETFSPSVNIPRGGGSDHASFNAVGVPGFFTNEGGNDKYGKSDYTFVHHTQHDRIDRAIAPYLVQSATNHAAVAFYLAQAPELLPRYPQPDTTAALNSDVPGYVPKNYVKGL